MTTITPIIPNVPQTGVQAEPNPRESREQQLRIDQVVRATVSEGGHERVWLNIGRQHYVAETEVPLQTGAHLVLRVSKTTPTVELKVVHDPLGERIMHALHLLNKDSWSLKELAASLARPETVGASSREGWKGFNNLMSETLSRPGDGGLVRLLTALGMDYEALIARSEISGAVSKLKRLMEEGRNGPENLERSVAKKLDQSANLFELWQLIRLKMSHQSVEFWPLPLLDIEQGYMVAERGEGERGGEGDEDERPWRISVNLKLPSLGNLQIDFLREKEGLFLRFQCSSPDTAGLLARSEEELQSSVSAIPLGGVAYVIGAQSPATKLVKLLAGDGVFEARV